MATVRELRVFYNQSDLMNGLEAFRVIPNAVIRYSTNTATIGDRVVKFMLSNNHSQPLMEKIQGLHFNRIWIDARAPQSDLIYAFVRLRSPEGDVDNHVKLFYQEVREL